jgi:leucyl aminopeptidase (aminopeptidase T)
MLVELGFGLSAGVPMGLIAADECLQGTFHLGIGDDSFFAGANPAPVHLDLVSRSADVEILARR